VLTNFDFISAASAADFQLTPTSAAPAPEALALEGSMPTEPAPGADTALPDLPPPELQQVEAGAGSEKQVGAPGAAPTDGAGVCLTAPASCWDPHDVC
jgi:hypothetical protein